VSGEQLALSAATRDRLAESVVDFVIIVHAEQYMYIRFRVRPPASKNPSLVPHLGY
jgi:hypothetical protein